MESSTISTLSSPDPFPQSISPPTSRSISPTEVKSFQQQQSCQLLPSIQIYNTSQSPSSSSSSASTSLDQLSLNKDTRPSTPPSPSSIQNNNNDSNYYNDDEYNQNIKSILSSISNNCHDYLQLIEPNPVPPPKYETLPPGGCPKFPISQPLSLLSESLTNSHYPVSPPSSTNSYISLSHLSNSYQQQQLVKPPCYSPAIYKIGVVSRKVEWINPYELSTNRSWKYFIMELNSTQLNFYHIPTNLEYQVINYRSDNRIDNIEKFRKLRSEFTNEYDYQFYNYVSSLGLLSKSPSKKTLIRSYSLQYLRLGLATDYKKKTNVLRLRIENEQILLNFSTTEQLINWNLSLNIGKDVSVDISERELPRYRTVPRRRRRRNTEPITLLNRRDDYDPFNMSRLRSASDSSRFKGKLMKLKSKLSSKSVESENKFYIENESDSRSILNNSNYDSPEQLNDPEFDEEFNAVLAQSRMENEPNLSDSHHSDTEDFEYEEDDEEEEDQDSYDREIFPEPTHTYNLNFSSDEDYKWNPKNDKILTKRKYYRNCLRCIKPLTMEDTWVDKVLVKPTTLSPLNMAYLRVIKYGGPNGEVLSSCYSSSTSLTSLNKKQTNALFKEGAGVSLPDFALTRLPNHFLKEFNVGSHGLIPKEII